MVGDKETRARGETLGSLRPSFLPHFLDPSFVEDVHAVYGESVRIPSEDRLEYSCVVHGLPEYGKRAGF